MDEVIKDLEEQFMTICNAANEVSALLEAGQAQYSSPSSELSAMKMLNPVALFRSASSRSSSSRFFRNSSSSRDESSDSSSGDFYEESSMVSGSHRSPVNCATASSIMSGPILLCYIKMRGELVSMG